MAFRGIEKDLGRLGWFVCSKAELAGQGTINIFHGAGGYLITRFLDNTSNKRTDQWEEVSKRFSNRFAPIGLEVLKVFGPEVAVKLSPAGGYNDVGMPSKIPSIPTLISSLKRTIWTSRLSCSSDTRKSSNIAIDGDPYASPISRLIHRMRSSSSTLKSRQRRARSSSLLKVDGIFIGFNFITHPDLVKRVLHWKALDNILSLT
ncbi:hypothetical protein BDZ97DRAFT_1917387 [Flammula alnicola]|nr:hypothetical protein BDZ97DRAFT_1917387 [Flammula alnicola]